MPQQRSASHSRCPQLCSGATFSAARYQASESSAKNALPTGYGAVLMLAAWWREDRGEGGLLSQRAGRERYRLEAQTDPGKRGGLSTRKLASHQEILRSAGRGYCCFRSCCRVLWLPGIARSLPELLLQSSVHMNWSGRQKNKTPSAGYVTCGEV